MVERMSPIGLVIAGSQRNPGRGKAEIIKSSFAEWWSLKTEVDQELGRLVDGKGVMADD
jgi:hypothetical protein